MDQIVLNTSQLKKQKDTLNSRKNYYAGKISTFQGSKYNATSTLSSLLSKIRTNYTTIGTNIKNVSEYLEDYYKDAEGIEYKFNHSGGSIQTSSVNSIANEYYDVIEKYEFPTQDYFKLSFADSITSAVNNLFTFRKVVETDSVDFVMEDSLYNDVLDIYTEQIDMSIEEYEMIAKEIEKEIDSFSSLESLISMGAAVGAVSAADYNTQLKEALEKSGFSSLEEYKKYINELKSNLSMCEEAVRQLELSKITGKYDCLLFAEDFQNYSYQGEISEENIRKLSGTMNEYSPLSFDYDKVYEKYEDVSLMAYVATLSKMYDESTIKAYATDEVWNAYELLEASNISQVSAGSSDCLVGSNLVNAYNYLFENYGREEASQYLTDIEDRVNQILGQNEAMKKLANLSSKDDIFSAIGNEVYVAGTGVGDGLQSWWENMGHAFSAVFSFFTGDTEESRAMTKEEYEAQFFMQGLQQGNYSGPFLINNYEISQGIGNMLPSIIITRGLGAAGVAASTASTAGSAMIGVSSFGGSYHSSMVEGYSQEQALTYGLISGSSEALFEKFLGGVLSDVRVVDGKSYLYSMAKEATEEGLQNVFDAGVRNVLFGEVQTGDELVESTLKSMLYGGITAGILNSPSAISNSVKSVKVNHAIQNGSLDTTSIIASLKNSGLEIEFDGKTDAQIISENVDIVYDMFKDLVSSNYSFNISDIEQALSKNVENYVRKTMLKRANAALMDDVDLALINKIASSTVSAIKAIPLDVLGFFKRFVSSDVQDDKSFAARLKENGLYHLTSLDSAKKIVESGYVKPSGVLASYGRPKAYFFNGVPSLEGVAFNLDSLPRTQVAVKIDGSKIDMDGLRYRSVYDEAVFSNGKFVFSKGAADIVYLALSLDENQDLKYIEVSKQEFDAINRLPTKNFDSIGSLVVAYDGIKKTTTLESYSKAIKQIGKNVSNRINSLFYIHNVISSLKNNFYNGKIVSALNGMFSSQYNAVFECSSVFNNISFDSKSLVNVDDIISSSINEYNSNNDVIISAIDLGLSESVYEEVYNSIKNMLYEPYAGLRIKYFNNVSFREELMQENHKVLDFISNNTENEVNLINKIIEHGISMVKSNGYRLSTDNLLQFLTSSTVIPLARDAYKDLSSINTKSELIDNSNILKSDYQISNMNEEVRTNNYDITREKNSLDFKQYINNYLQNVSKFKFSDVKFSKRLKHLGNSIYSYFSGNYEIGTSDMTFEALDSQAELISDTLSYSDVDQLKNLLDSGQEGDLAKVLVDGTLTANLDQNISNKALENFKRSSETLIKFFKTTLKNIKNANQIFANMLAKVTQLDSVESDNLNGNLLGKFVGTFGYEFLSGTLMNKRKFTSVTNSKIMLDTIQNEGILHFTSPSTANKIMESGMIKKSGILTSDMTSPKSFFFGGIPTFEDLLINVPAYEVMTAVKIHPTDEQISQLKYRPLNDRAVVYDGDFHFDPSQAEIVYYGLAYDKENNNIFLKQITKEEAQNYHVSEEVKSAYNYNIKGNSLVDEIKMNIYGLYAEYKHHQRLQQFVAQWEQKGLKLNEITDQELYDLWNIKEASVLNKQSIEVLNDFINKSDVSSESSASTQDIRIDEIISDSSEYFDRFINDPVNEEVVQDLIDVKNKVLSLKTKENLLEYIDNEATPFALNLLTFNIFNNPLLETLLSNKTVQSFLNRNYSKIELINKYAYMQYSRHEFVIDTFLSLTATDLDSLDFIDLYNVVNSFSEEVQAKFLQKNPNIFDSKLDSLDEESLSAFVFGDFLNFLSFNSQTKLVDSYPNYFNKKFDEFVSSKNYSNEIKRYIIKNCGNYQLFKDLNFSLKYLDSDTQIVFFEKCKSSLYNDSLKCFMEYAGYINDPKYQEKFVKESPFFEEIHTSSGLSSFCSNIKSTDLLVELLYNPKSQSEIISNYSIFKEIMNKLNLSIDEQKKFLEPVKQEIIKKRNKIYYRVDNGYLFQYIDSFSPEVQQILLHDEDFLNTISVSDKIALNSAYNNVYYNDLLSLLHQPFDMDSARLLFEPEFYQLMDQDMINQAALSLRPSDYSRLAQLNNVEAIDTVINRMIGTNYKGISKTQLIPILEIANSSQKQNIMNSIPFSLLLEINSNYKSEELTNLMIQKISLDNEQLTKSDYANLTYLKQDVYLKIYPYLDDKAKLCSYDKHNVNSEIQKEVLAIFRKSPDLINLMSSSSLGNFYDSLSLPEDIDLFYQNLSLTTLSFANKILVSHFDLAKFKDFLINKISDFKTNKSSEVNFQYLNLFSVNDQIDIINSMSKVYQYFILLDGQLQNQEVMMYVLNNMMNDSDFRSYIGKVSNFSKFLDNLSVDNSKYILENANDKFLGFLFALSKRSDIQLKFQEKLHDNPVLLGEYKLEDAEVMYEKLDVQSKTQLNETLDQMLDSIYNPSVNEIFKDATTAQKSAFLKAYNEGLIDSEKISFLLELKKQNQFVLGTFNYELFDSEIYQLNSALLTKLSKYYEVVGLISRIKNDSVKFNLFNNLMQLNSDLSLVVSDQKMSIILSYLSDRSFIVDLVPKTQEELEVFQNILLKQYDLFALVTGDGRSVIHRDRSLIEPEGYTYSNYYTKLNEQCDILMNSVQDITEAQNILFNKYFSMSVEDAQELYRIYGSHFSDITNLDENGIATVYLENLVNIFEASSLEEVKDIYYHFDSFYTMEENLIIMDEIRKIYTKSLKNTLFNPVNISDFIEYDGNLVPIYEVSDEFQMLIQSTATSYGGMSMINNNYFDSWNLSSRTSNHGICCSLISNSNMGMASVSGNGIVIGFNSFADNQINMMAPYDLYTYNDQYNIRSARPMLFLPGEEVINQTRHTHNEFNLERVNLEENSKYANIQPDYVVWFEDMDETLKNNAFKASLEFEIPLVYVNKEKIAKMECQKIDQYISDYQTTGNLENILQALLLHENNRSGYRISNQELISQYFPTEKIDTLFRTAISNSNTLEQLEFIKQILLNEQQKFDITYEATDRINVIDLPIEEYIQLLDDKISSL